MSNYIGQNGFSNLKSSCEHGTTDTTTDQAKAEQHPLHFSHY
jgi:hypothetical protein